MTNDDIFSMLDKLESDCAFHARPSEYYTDGVKVISLSLVLDFISRVKNGAMLKTETPPIKKFLFVEDGSVDTDELEEILEQRNPDIQLVVYRQGSDRPHLRDVAE